MDWFQMIALCAFVAATPPPGYIKRPEIDEHPPKYEFGYSVRDGHGGAQGHLETRDGEFALGKYFVNLPSNQQKVDYFADDWGYHPLVEYKTSSGSSSMSTQFAMGERAVAALSRQHGVEPPLEIFKTKTAQSPVAGLGPQISIQGSSGVIPGPSEEPIHNSLDGETYSSPTTPTLSTAQLSQTPSTPVYESSSENNIYQQSGTFEVSSVSPDYDQPLEVQSTTGSHLVSSVTNAEVSRDQYDVQKNTDNYASDASHTTPSNYPRHESSDSQEAYQTNEEGTYTSTSSGIGQYEKSFGNPEDKSQHEIRINYQTSPVPGVSPELSYEKQPSYSNERGSEVGSYIADANAAVRVNSNNELEGASRYSPNNRISTVFVEGGNAYEENDIRSVSDRYVSSTTSSPPKTVLKPIVVTDSGDYASSLALFSAQKPSTERYKSKFTKGKLYHREGRVKSEGGYSTESISNVRPESGTVKAHEYYSTPAPTPEPVLVTPRLEASRLTSAGNILAPLQAGLSLSTQQHNAEDCDEAVSHIQEKIPSSGPDVEKQVVREEAVYKTTIDVQKSIPFEIHPDEEEKYSQNTHGSEDLREVFKANIYDEGSKEAHQHSSQVEYNHVNSENNANIKGNYQNNQVETGQEFSAVPLELPPQSEYGSPSHTNNYNQNNFIQQVMHAYHRMANNLREQSQREGAYPIGIQTPAQHFYVPNKMYYVYLQGSSPYFNRYGQQQDVYANYNSPISPTSTVEIPSNALSYNAEYVQENKGGLAQEWHNSGTSNSLGNSGYAMAVNHEEGQGNKAYDSSANERPQYVNAVVGSQASYGQYEAAKDLASGLNNLKEPERDLLGVHLNNKHAHYSTGLGDESTASIGGSYQLNGKIQSEENHESEEKYTAQFSKDLNYNPNVPVKEFPVPQYITKLIEVEKPVHNPPHPVPVEYTKIVPTQAVEYTKAVTDENPVPYAVTKLITLPLPYAVPHPVPVPQLLPYPQMVPVKGYRPVFLFRKPTGQRLLHREALHSKNQASFRPSQPVFGPHPPETYRVMSYFRGPAKRRGNGRQLCIEYGGFKPPLVPSVQVDEEPKPSYGPPTEEKKK